MMAARRKKSPSTARKSTGRTAKKAKRAPSTLREDDALALIHSVRGRSPTAKRARALIAVAAGAGLRLGEMVAAVELRTVRRGEKDPKTGKPATRTHSVKVLEQGKAVRVPGLTGADVRQDKAGRWFINVACGKRSKSREVPVRRAFVPFLVDWLEARRELRRGKRRIGSRDPLFCTVTTGSVAGFGSDSTVRVGDPMTDDSARGLLSRVVKNADLDVARIHWHALRSAFATASIEDGVPLPQVQTWLGHAGAGMTLHYAQRARASDDVLDRVAGTTEPEPDPKAAIRDELRELLSRADELRKLLE